MHGEVRSVPGRADPDLVGRMNRGLEKKNCKQDQKDLFHFLPLKLKPAIQAFCHFTYRSSLTFDLITPVRLRSHFRFSTVQSSDYSIRSVQHGLRYCQTDLFFRFEIYHQLELRRLFDGKVGGLGTLENSVNVIGDAPVTVREVRPRRT